MNTNLQRRNSSACTKFRSNPKTGET